jgi:hypothetical protein
MTSDSDALLREPTVESIRLRLGHYDSRSTGRPKWAQIVKHGRGQAFGELRDPIDWRGLPKEGLRVVWLVDDKGPVIRWMWPEHRSAGLLLGGTFHDDLERGDGHGEACSGWLYVSDAGVRVTP